MRNTLPRRGGHKNSRLSVLVSLELIVAVCENRQSSVFHVAEDAGCLRFSSRGDRDKSAGKLVAKSYVHPRSPEDPKL